MGMEDVVVDATMRTTRTKALAVMDDDDDNRLLSYLEGIDAYVAETITRSMKRCLPSTRDDEDVIYRNVIDRIATSSRAAVPRSGMTCKVYWSDGRTTRIDPSIVDGDVRHVDDDDDDNNGCVGSSSVIF